MLIKPIVVITTLLKATSTSAQEERAPIISLQNGEIKATIEFDVPGVAYDKSPTATHYATDSGETAAFFNSQQANAHLFANDNETAAFFNSQQANAHLFANDNETAAFFNSQQVNASLFANDSGEMAAFVNTQQANASIFSNDNETKAFFNAQQVNANTNNIGILLDFVNGFGDMANVVFSEMYNGNGSKRSMGLPGDIHNYNAGGDGDRKLIRINKNRKLQSMEPVVVTDITCPTTLSYPIPNGGECLNFHVKIDAGTMSMSDATTFENLINAAIDDGYLYDFVLAESEDTHISGLGDPGKGFDFEENTEDIEIPATLPATAEDEEEGDEAIVINVSGSAWDISSYDGSDNVPDFYNAQDVMDNTDSNDILIQFIDGIGSVSNDIFGNMFGGNNKKKTLELNVFGRKLQRFLQSLEPVMVTDIACPETSYTPPPGVTCLNFEVTILPGDMSSEDISTFEEMMNEVVNDGGLYDTIQTIYPDTKITGLGEPGYGYDYKSAALENETTEAQPTTTEDVEETATTTTEAPILDVEGEEELGPVIPDVEETTTTIAPDEPDTDEPDEAPPVACTMELFVCPDGTTVGREGPDCEFPECPEEDTEEEEDQEYPVEEIEPDTPPELAVACTLDVKICPDGTALSREGVDCEFPECPAATESITETHSDGVAGKSGKSMKSEKAKASKSQDVAFSKSAKKQKTGHEMLVADAKAEKKGKSEKMNDGTTPESEKVEAKATKKASGSAKSSKTLFTKSSKGVTSAKSTKKLGSKMHKQTAHSMPTRRLRTQ